MNIWKYKTDTDNYQGVWLIKQEDSRLFTHNFLGERFQKPWIPISVHYHDEWKDVGLTKEHRKYIYQQMKDVPKGDFPSFTGTTAVFTKRAVQVFQPLIEKSVEFLPLQCEEEELFLVNVIDVVDSLDIKLSKIKRFSNGGIIQVLHFEFKNKDVLESKIIFKIKGMPVDIFVTDLFKTIVEKHNLKGLIWNPLP